MEIIIDALNVIQTLGISIGVGSSTLAVLNFFYAIKDGTISETERNFMGITYHVLRTGMVIILVTTTALALIGFNQTGLEYFSSLVIAEAILIFTLFANAILMTARIMPSTFGPAIQAGSWYTLGFISALAAQGIFVENLIIFLLSYLTFVIFCISFINAVMGYLKEKLSRNKNIATERIK